jgi:diguanylate cyclase (GGDEF)-like protein
MSLRDRLTGLRSREEIDGLVETGAWRAGRSVVVVDLDRFRAISDTYGHHVGDEVLRALADRLREVAGEDDLVVRTGGDEFAVFVPTVKPAVARLLGERVRVAIASAIPVDGVAVYVDCSVGIASGSSDDPMSRLMSRADACIYRIKSSGSAHRVVAFDPDEHSDALDTLALTADLRGALEREEFVLHYQPIR